MEEFITEGKDLVEAQRSKDRNKATDLAEEALATLYCTFKKGKDWKLLTQEDFDRQFGVRQIVMAGGMGTRYSVFIHKVVATGGTGRSNIELAMEGSSRSPTFAPLVLVNPKILGLIVKGKYLEGYDEETGSFKIENNTLKEMEYQLIDSVSVYIDKDLLKRYFGRDDILLLYLPTPLGPGGDLLKAVQILCEHGYETPYIEVVHGEMSPSVLPEYPNTSLAAYLKILGGNYVSVVGAKESKGKIEFKGNFAFNKGRLAAHEDWERIPHEEYTDKKEQKEFDRVLEQEGGNYRRVKDILAEMQKQREKGIGDDEQICEQVRELRDVYPYFVISDEGELFSQEKVQETRDRLENWSTLSAEEREYLKRNYAVLEFSIEEADLMISANVGIFRMNIIKELYNGLRKEFDEQGHREYYEALERGESVDNRRVGRFWGVDWKSGRSKAIVWSFSRIIRDYYLNKYPGEEPPVALVDVVGAPSSIKNADRQFAFTEKYVEVYGVHEEVNIDTRWSEILKLEKEVIEKELLDLLKVDVDRYRKIVHGLFFIGKGCVGTQLKVFSVFKEIEDTLERGDKKTLTVSPELIHGFHLNAVVEAIDRDYFDRELMFFMNDEAGSAVIYYFSPLDNHPGSGYIKEKLDILRVTHDVRPFVRDHIKKALRISEHEYFVREGGFASIDINRGIDKEVALKDFVYNEGIDLEATIYFGDEFDSSGNDTPVVRLKNSGKNSGFRIISVGPTPPADEKEVDWVGGGPERTKAILLRILDGLKEKKDVIVIDVNENGIQVKMEIDLTKLRKGGLVFDIDGTILQRKEHTFHNDEEVRDIFKALLQEGIKIGILSGNSRIEQSSRIVNPLREVGSDLGKLVLYANGGATRVVYKKGKEEVENLGGVILEKDIDVVKSVVEKCAGEQFGLDNGELIAWRDFYGAGKSGIGHREGFPELDAAWMNKKEWELDIVKVEDILEKNLKRVSCPWIEVRDKVQISIKLLPKRLDLAKVEFS